MMDVCHGVFLNIVTEGKCPWSSSNATGYLALHGKREGLLRKLYRRVSMASFIDPKGGKLKLNPRTAYLWVRI
jgi:hypothetical protein